MTARIVSATLGSRHAGLPLPSRGGTVGTDHIAPDTAYHYQAALPLGTHLSAHPDDWSPANYWRALGVRSQGSDHDLELYSATWFDDPATRDLLASSRYGANNVDLIAVDGNHRPPQPEHYVINRYSGSGGYAASWSHQRIAVYWPGWYGPYTMGEDEVVKVFDVLFDHGQGKKISIVPTTGDNDLGVALFRSDGDDSATWARGRSHAIALADDYGSGDAVESVWYWHSPSASDFLGLVVFSKIQTPASFWIFMESPIRVYLPIIVRQK